MKLVVPALAALLLLGGQSAQAADSMHAPMAVPKCAKGDPVIDVNMAKNTYMLHGQKTAGMTNAKTSMMKNRLMPMCRSAAVRMGAKMMRM